MQKIVPQKLQKGDEIRVIAPASSLKIIGEDCRKIAAERFEKMGLKVSFAKNTKDENCDCFISDNIEKRAADVMEAFLDKSVKAIFTILGGFNSNQILPFLDYEAIKQNPKIICGFSDITALLNAINAKTGLEVFYGPHYSSIGMLKGCEYTIDCLQKMLFEGAYDLVSSQEWSDDLWFLDQQNRKFEKNEGWLVIHDGEAKGKIAGGNLGTYVLLNGTQYQPKWEEDTVLFVEDCFTAADADGKYFLRQLQALAQRDDFANVKAVVIGRFQKASEVDRNMLLNIVAAIPQLKDLPIIANVDFGHTTPIATLPIGGNCVIKDGKIRIEM